MYQAILFDLDNTLLFPETALNTKLTALRINGEALFTEDTARMAQREAELWTARQILHEIETNTRMDDDLFLENVLSFYNGEAGIQGAEAAELIRNAVTDRAKSIPVPEVYDLLDSLGKKFKLGIVSNNSARVRGVLDEFNLTQYFQTITISAEIGIEKPDPRIMLETCRILGVEPENCLYVGDHPFDILCTARAGMDCVWLNNGIFRDSDLPIQPKYRIQSITELQDLIG